MDHSSIDWRKVGLCIVLWVVLVLAILAGLFFFADMPAREYLKAHRPHGFIKDTFIFFSAYAEIVPLGLLIWACLIAGPKSEKWRMVVQVGLGLLLMCIPVHLSKIFMSRFRPSKFKGSDWWEGFFTESAKLLGNYGTQSFPSGHAAMAFVVSTILAYHFPAYRAILYVLAFGCAISRYVLNSHWLSDIFAGAIIGYLVGKLVLLLTGDVRTGSKG